jgi:hypothetical protein
VLRMSINRPLNSPFRAQISERVAREKGMSVIFLESVCNDPAVIAANVALKVSSGDPDYKDMSREEAKADFLRRIRQYETVYETITEPHLSYLRITDVGDQVTVCRIHGYLQSRIAFYLMNLHLKPRSIFFSRVCRDMLSTFRSSHLLSIAWRKPVQRGREDRWRRSVIKARDAVRKRVTRTHPGQYWRCTIDGLRLVCPKIMQLTGYIRCGRLR